MKLRDAIRLANGYAKSDRIAYVFWSEDVGWHPARRSSNLEQNCYAEFLCLGYDRLPIPLTAFAEKAIEEFTLETS